MRKYRCFKIVEAQPMDRLEAEELGLVRDKTGVLEKGYHVVYFKDYESWTPAVPFEERYRLTIKERLWDFGRALKAYYLSAMEYLRS
ncbi:MAG: hypothetical protein N4A76_08690 [Firmicutes bacterium]|jgi:hypothetical protein|nr:hypothetical protein [Bacillota bacterium]